MAQEINELYASGADGLFVTLKELGIDPEREVPLREAGVEYVVDLTIPCRDGTLAIALGERPAPEGALRLGATECSPDDVQRVVEAVERLGGVRL